MALVKYKSCGERLTMRVFIILSIQTVLVTCQTNKNLSPNPIGGRFVPVIRPSQSLLPPHREEGQSLDDIIYGFSSPLFTPPPTTTTSTTTTQRPTVFITSTATPTPSPPLRPSQSPFIPTNNAFGGSGFDRNRFSNTNNLVQTFTPPPGPVQVQFSSTRLPSSPTQPPRFSPTVRARVSNSIGVPNSAEEIKVPQPVKLRSEKKQYTKADLIAAANSLKPAGFDFSKVLIFTPNNFQNTSVLRRNEVEKNIQNTVERVEDNSLSPLYHHVMFPLPLFDTPVFRPVMDMLLKQQQAKLGSLTTSDNKKVLVIIPKSAGLGSSQQLGRSVPGAQAQTQNHLQQQQRDQRSHQILQQLQKTTTVRPPPSSKFNTTPPKFIIVPKGGKIPTTSKPKSSSLTTKRIPKQIGLNPRKEKEKGTDLQVAATSNKLSQRPNTNPSSTEKRSYSSKGEDKYSFSYAVKNDAFGDVKSHSESRDGDQVEGEYSMLEADGYTRVVRYVVNSGEGFKASVRRIPPS